MRRPALLLVALAAAALVAPGCRPGTALGDRYNNFRAYYNTYYNASRSLEEGEEALENDGAAIDRDRLVRVFPVTGGGGGQQFEDAVEKSAELLRTRPTSKWADDALLVIGKAYFYQRNFAGAEQKFRETAAAAETTGDSRLGDEAQFWLGRTYAATERYDEGVAVLQEGLAREDVDRRWQARMRLALGELYALAGRWDEAAEALREGAADVGGADLAARAYVLLGQVEEYAGRYDEAAGAYGAALDRGPTFELAYAAALNRALVLGLDAGDADAGLALVARMQGDDKYYERRGELALTEARLLAAAGRTTDAQRLFLDVLYDPDLDGQRVRGAAHYRVGEFYRDALGDYVRASAHFDSAATSLQPPPPDVLPARAAVLDVDRTAQTYASLAETALLVTEADSLLALGALPDEAFAARIEEIEAERLRVYQEQQRRLEAERAAQAFSGEGARFEDGPGGSASPPAVSGTLQAGGGGADAGFLSYRDQAAIQAGLVAFEQRWGSRPLVPDWRRIASVRATGLTSGVGGVEDEATGPTVPLGQGPPPLDIARVPRTPAKREELNRELAQLRYELANAFFLSLGRADTAAALYRRILDDTPDLPAAVRARYALAEIERAAGRDDVARPLYEEVVAADPTTELARASRERLGLGDRPAPAPEGAGPAAGAPVETSAAYDAVRAQWRGGAPREAAAAFVALADVDPDSAAAARAYLAAALAYTEWARDSLSLTAPLPSDVVSDVLRRVARPSAAPPPGEPTADAPVVDVPVEDDPVENEFEDEPVEETEPETGGVAPPLPQPQRRAADSLAVTPPALADSVRVPADSTVAFADSTAGPGGAASAVPDSLAFTLRDHLAAIAALYPATVYAERADALLAALPAPPPSAAAPPAGAPVVEAQTGATPDSLAVEAPADPAVPVPEPERVAGPPDPTTDSLSTQDVAPPLPELRGAAPLDPSQGGVTWRIRTLSIPSEGEALARGLRRAGYRAAVVTGGEASYVVVGQFETAEAAEAVRGELPNWAQSQAEVVPIADFSVVPPSEGGAGDFRP